MSGVNLRKAALCAAFLLFTGVSSVSAGNVGISPLRVDFNAMKKSGVVRVFNTGDQDIQMQVEARDWVQAENGADQYDSTNEVLAVPPIFSLEPGETQIIRVGQLGGQQPDRERTYRLFLRELPRPQAMAEGGQLQMRLVISLPIFSAPTLVPADADLEMVETSREGDRLRARFRNPGNTHIRVQDLTAFTMEGEEAQKLAAAAYVLPGATHDFFFDMSDGLQIARLRAETDTVGIMEYEVVTP